MVCPVYIEGFALAAPEIARIGTALGPWPVSSAALAIGAAALADFGWSERTPIKLAEAALRLDACLVKAGLEVIGGTSLFRLVRSKDAGRVFQSLGETGIMVWRFAEHPSWLRFGLPGGASEWQRLETALTSIERSNSAWILMRPAPRAAVGPLRDCLAPLPARASDYAHGSFDGFSLAPHSFSCWRSQP